MMYLWRRSAKLAALVGLIVLSGGRPDAQGDPNAYPNPYRAIENYFKLPDGRTWGSTTAVEIDRDGTSIWFFERCGAAACSSSSVAPIVKYDASGKLVRSFGTGMFNYPHGIHIDRDGNLWVTDGATNPAARGGGAATPAVPPTKGHQVFKFSPEGKVLLTLGKAGVAGDGPDTFNQPSDVLVAPNGDIFVADGHGGNSNARMVKFTKDGKFIKAWGTRGTAPGDFDTPHALAMDSRGRLFVGDRGNGRVQIFDQDGKFLEEWKQFGRPSGIFIDRNDMLYVADHQSNEKVNVPFRKGIRIGSVKDGKVTAFILDPDPNGSQEGVAADAKGNVYGTLTGGMAVKKYVKER